MIRELEDQFLSFWFSIVNIILEIPKEIKTSENPYVVFSAEVGVRYFSAEVGGQIF